MLLFFRFARREEFFGDLREGDVSPKKIVIAAIGFCRKHGICWQEARAWLCERVHFAFRAGGMLPRTDSWSDNAHVFDADWLTFFCSIVAQETREKVSVVMYDMGLGSCCYYFIQALRKKNKKRKDKDNRNINAARKNNGGGETTVANEKGDKGNKERRGKERERNKDGKQSEKQENKDNRNNKERHKPDNRKKHPNAPQANKQAQPAQPVQQARTDSGSPNE